MVEALKPRSALDGVYQPGRFGADAETPGLIVTARTGLTLTHVEYAQNDSSTALELAKILGGALPTATNAADVGKVRVIWMGPARRLIVGNVPDLAAALPAAAINDISSSRTVLRLSGPKLREVLAAGCPLDLHPGVFKTGCCATSHIGHFTATLDCFDAMTIDVYVARAYGLSFFEWLTEAAEEVGYEVTDPAS